MKRLIRRPDTEDVANGFRTPSELAQNDGIARALWANGVLCGADFPAVWHAAHVFHYRRICAAFDSVAFRQLVGE